MNDFYDRLKKEQVELNGKIEKLRAFIWDGSPIYEKLSQVDQHLLANQLHAMRQYSEILQARLERVAFS